MKMTEKHAKNNVIRPVITTSNLNYCLSTINERKTNFILCIFSGKTYLFEEVAQTIISTHLQTWLTYHFTSKRARIREDSS